MSVLKTYGNLELSLYPSKTYRLSGKRIEGTIDGKEAVAQAIELLLTTERFSTPIFSADYGVELEELVGKRRSYLLGDIERRIREALAVDDRIEAVEDFTVTFRGECAVISFTAFTVFGEIPVERRVELGRV